MVEEGSKSPFWTPVGSSLDKREQFSRVVREGGSGQRDGNSSLQMTPQEKRQYEWYMKKYEKADTTRNPNAERERISMILAALFPHHSHMPPERNERKVGKKKSPQGETPEKSRDAYISDTKIYASHNRWFDHYRLLHVLVGFSHPLLEVWLNPSTLRKCLFFTVNFNITIFWKKTSNI